MSGNKKLQIKNIFSRVLVFGSAAIIVIDFVYRQINNIDYATREKCILYKAMPKGWFLFYEYFIELVVVIVIGLFIAVLLKKYFLRYRQYFPKSPLGAFLYGSLVPICACGILPLVKTMRGKINTRTLITLVVAAPILSPPIIILSFSVLGVKYGLLRIAASFFLSISAGLVVEYFEAKWHLDKSLTQDREPQEQKQKCNPQGCQPPKKDIYLETFNMFVSLLPYLFLAGLLGAGFELFVPKNFVFNHFFSNNFLGMVLLVAIGIPMYVCNGAEVIILKPLIHTFGLSLGAAVAFSLTSSAICITSTVILAKFLGKKLTFILVGYVFLVSLFLGYLINLFFHE